MRITAFMPPLRKHCVMSRARASRRSRSSSSVTSICECGPTALLQHLPMAKSGNSGGIIIWIVIVAALAAGGYYFWKSGADKPPEFTTTNVGLGEVVQNVTATGDLQP